MTNLDYCWTKRFLLKIKTILYSSLLLISLQFSYSQKIIEIDKIEGCQVLYPNMTVEEAQTKAVVQAKLNALQQSGISEQISLSQIYEVERGVRVQQDKFYESTSTDVKGEIVKFNLIGYSQSVGSTGEILICAEAKIDILKHDASQRNNNLSISGINDRYKRGDAIAFKLKSPSDLYYWVFWIDSDGKYQLIYPISKDQSNKIQKNQEVTLPNSNDYKWNVDTNKIEEINSILIAYSNSNYLVNDNIIDFNSWSNWYQKLEYDSRNKITMPFKIYKQ